MLKRLQSKSSTFDVVKWHKQESDRKKILSNIKDYRWEEVRMHQSNMQKTLSGGKFMPDNSFLGNSFSNSQRGSTAGAHNQNSNFKGQTFFNRRGSTANQTGEYSNRQTYGPSFRVSVDS